MAFLLLHGRKNGREFHHHVVPSDVDASVVLELPVHAHGDVDPRVASDDNGRRLAGSLGG